MKILIAPLNWGLGHATRCAALVRRYMRDGHEVVIAGDGESLVWMRREFPDLRFFTLAPLRLHYGRGNRQVWAMLCALPQLLRWAVADHAVLKDILAIEHFDYIISDNRFGFFPDRSYNRSHSAALRSVYITHQIHICLPKPWRWLEGLVSRLHACVINRYNELWVPDYAIEPSLAGELSHGMSAHLLCHVKYIGPLSRFVPSDDMDIADSPYTLAVLSGLEPQRTQFEKELLARFRQTGEQLVLVQGLVNKPNTVLQTGNISIYPWMGDKELQNALSHASHIIARSGYSTIMDLAAMNLLDRAELHPTPGQPEQEYLSRILLERAKC